MNSSGPSRKAVRRGERGPDFERPVTLASSEVELIAEVGTDHRLRAEDGKDSRQTTEQLPLPPPVMTPGETSVTATMTPTRPPAFLYIDRGPGAGRAVPVLEGELVVGRSSSAHLHLDHASVSRHHLKIRRSGDRYFVQDLDSHNGSFLNGRSVKGEVEIFSGDEIALGRIVLVFRTNAPYVTGRMPIPLLERTDVRVAIFGSAALLGIALVLLFARLKPAPATPHDSVPESAELQSSAAESDPETPVDPTPEPQQLPAPTQRPAAPASRSEISATRILEESRKKTRSKARTKTTREERPAAAASE